MVSLRRKVIKARKKFLQLHTVAKTTVFASKAEEVVAVEKRRVAQTRLRQAVLRKSLSGAQKTNMGQKRHKMA